MRLGMFMMPVHPPDRAVLEHARRGHREVAAGRPARLRRALAGRAFLGVDRTDPFAADVLRQSRCTRPRTCSFGTAVINMPNHHPAIVAAECRAVRPHEQGPLHAGHRPGRADLRLRAVQDDRPRRAQPHGGRGRRHDRAHLGAGPALRSQGRVLGHLDQGRHHCQARRRLHAEALPAAAARRSSSRSQARTRRRPRPRR